MVLERISFHSSCKDFCPGITMLNHIESDPVKVYDASNVGLRVFGNKSKTKHCWQWLSVKKIV